MTIDSINMIKGKCFPHIETRQMICVAILGYFLYEGNTGR